MTLTLTETQNRLQKTNFEALPKPRKNKGVRGQLLELALGIPNASSSNCPRTPLFFRGLGSSSKLTFVSLICVSLRVRVIVLQ